MSTPLKIGIGGLALTAISGTGVLMWNVSEPQGKTIEELKDSDYSNKFGDDFKHHMVSAKDSSNDAWWNWSFDQRWKKSGEVKNSEFNDLSDWSALKEKCKSAYGKETKKDIRQTEKDVWKYCSLEGQRPITIKDSQNKDQEVSSEGNTGKIAEESSLIATSDPRNNRFWEIQEKAFFKATDGLGSKATENSIFKDLYEKKSDTLRNTCKLAFGKEKTDTNNKKHALMFCSLDAKDN